jgi:uncharacterized protein with HEPN domain
MTQHDDGVTLQQMLDHAAETRDMTAGRSEMDLLNDRMLELAVLRLLEVVGEAAARVSQATRDKHPEIPWPKIVALRNRLIHAYDRVDCEIVWAIVQKDIPPLIAALERAVDAD